LQSRGASDGAEPVAALDRGYQQKEEHMRFTSLRLLLVVAALVAITTPGLSAEPPIDSPEQKVLDKWVGSWRTTYKLPKAEWTPEEKTGMSEHTTSRVVGGRFVQEKSEHSDKTSGSLIFTYDAQLNSYRSWWFSSAGYTSESSGHWDTVTQTMTWTAKQDGNTTTTKHRFVDDDNTEWAVLVKDGNGKILFRMEGKSVRAKEPKK
jgi:hypothetical protein